MVNSYKRNQVELAIWQTVANPNEANREPPKKFGTRIKRLLELDRAQDDGVFAFSDLKPQGRGADVAFSKFNAFCLALGIELLDAGYKQAEIVFLLQHIRPQLKKAFSIIQKHPSPLRNVADTDFRIFVLIEKVEINEIYPARKDTKTPLIFEPFFCQGIGNLQEEINKRGWNFRKAMILELSTTGTLVSKYLDEVPMIRRGKS